MWWDINCENFRISPFKVKKRLRKCEKSVPYTVMKKPIHTLVALLTLCSFLLQQQFAIVELFDALLNSPTTTQTVKDQGPTQPISAKLFWNEAKHSSAKERKFFCDPFVSTLGELTTPRSYRFQCFYYNPEFLNNETRSSHYLRGPPAIS